MDSRKYSLLSELSSDNDTWMIKTRAIRLWTTINTKTNDTIGLEMILLDEKVSANKSTLIQLIYINTQLILLFYYFTVDYDAGNNKK